MRKHTDDYAVERFAIAMKAKLADARAKGRGGWDDPSSCSVEHLAALLIGHTGKGNPGNFEDIANLAMMLHQRGADPAILAGTLIAPAVPKGWKLLPIEPLLNMMSDRDHDTRITAERELLAILAAEPAPQVQSSAPHQSLIDWAVTSWHEQVAHRPMENVYRRTLDSVWRQVIRFAGEDPQSIIGPSHDDLLQQEQKPEHGEE